ncbi:MAG: nitroreductase family deazaflavin-dependent oxidoreductase [Pseudonocardia sp.]|uniref:nitroreductase/quinone reductase family protein n=1 Tax=unclassified Pseudonocardia TaxID=2619320 RepID=UPI001AC0FA7D|nr:MULTISPECIES: nitroreductase/quinone reductase family protein [unclassified Pseudonocardia]MBN9108302.1 nitroreductase family deazaflavin-dependent oxidoreductase [Pseudonocardia sp.]
MPGPDLVALNASMIDKILSGPPDPIVDGGYARRVLRTRGRRTGLVRSTPMGVVGLGGSQYLVCPDTHRDWARNLAADPDCTIASRDAELPATTVPVPDDEAAPVVVTYLSAMRNLPFAINSFPVGPDATPDEIRPHLRTIRVLRLEPRAAA